MAAKLPPLSTDVIANTKPFERGMGRVKQASSAAADRIRSFGSSITRFVGGAGGKFTAFAGKATTALAGFMAGPTGVLALGSAFSAAGAAAVAAARHFAKVGDAIQKMGIRTGVATGALSELQFAAGRSGADVASLEAGFRGMARFLLNAERGLKSATDTLGDLGLSVRDLSGLSPEDRFAKFATAISRVSDPTKRAGLAMQIFGKSGTDLLPLLAEGGRGIQALREEAKRLGLTFEQDAADRAAALTDAVGDVGASLSALKRRIGDIVSEVTGATEGFNSLAGAIGMANQALQEPRARRGAIPTAGQFLQGLRVGTGRITSGAFKGASNLLEFGTLKGESIPERGFYDRGRPPGPPPRPRNEQVAERGLKMFGDLLKNIDRNLETQAERVKKERSAPRIGAVAGGLGKSFAASILQVIGQNLQPAGAPIGQPKQPDRLRSFSRPEIGAYDIRSAEGYRAAQQPQRDKVTQELQKQFEELRKTSVESARTNVLLQSVQALLRQLVQPQPAR